jgi:hypothetical protein
VKHREPDKSKRTQVHPHVPLKADLLKAQRVWKRLLESVIVDKRIRRIDGNDGEPVAYVVPVEQYRLMNLPAHPVVVEL